MFENPCQQEHQCQGVLGAYYRKKNFLVPCTLSKQKDHLRESILCYYIRGDHIGCKLEHRDDKEENGDYVGS